MIQAFVTSIRARAGGFGLLGGGIFLIGLALRLHGISDQILMDDEWHSMLYVTGASLTDLFTHMGRGATCIPFNVFQKIMLETVGWNEVILRLPSILGGILCLGLFPFFVEALFNRRVAILFTILLALSPYLIFTGRFARPYSLYLLLSFGAIHAFYMWAVSGRLRYGAAYILAGALAVYFHLFAIVVIVIPPFYAIAVGRSRRLKGPSGSREVRVSAKKVFGILVACLALSGVLLLPALVNSPGFFESRPRVDPPTLASFMGYASLIAGSSNVSVIIVFCLLWAGGQAWLIKTNRFYGGLFAAITLSFLTVIMASAPPGMDIPIQIARYCIPIFPMAFVCVAAALDQGLTACARKMGIPLGHTNRGLSDAVITGAAVVLFVIGPLPGIYGKVNNFTNHAAYQESYEPLKWDRPYRRKVFDSMTLPSDRRSEFYRLLEKEKEDVILVEYPMFMGFHFNIYYFYQHFHQKRVIAGYVTHLENSPLREEGDTVYGNMTIDFVLSLVRDKDRDRLKFKNMVDATSRAALMKTGARYMVIHKNLLAEGVGQRVFDRAYLPALSLEKQCRREFGNPVFKDVWLTVFEIPPRPNAAP